MYVRFFAFRQNNSNVVKARQVWSKLSKNIYRSKGQEHYLILYKSGTGKTWTLFITQARNSLGCLDTLYIKDRFTCSNHRDIVYIRHIFICTTCVYIYIYILITARVDNATCILSPLSVSVVKVLFLPLE